MTFQNRVVANRIVGGVSVAVGLAVLAFVTYYLTVFVLFAVAPFMAEQRAPIGVLIAFISAYSFGMGFVVRSIFRDNIDITVSRMGPLQRQALKSAIEEEEGE